MAKLDSLTIEGYKSIQSLIDFKLNDLNILIGANGAGKSNFISLFRLLNNIYHQNLQFYVQKQGGVDSILHFGSKNTSYIYTKLDFSCYAYAFALTTTNDNRLIFGTEDIFSSQSGYEFPYKQQLGTAHTEAKISENYLPLIDSLEIVQNAIQSWQIYHFHDTSDTAKIKRQHPLNDNLVLKSDAENLAPYLYMLKDKYLNEYQRIVDTIRLVLPFFDDFVHRKNAEFVELEWLQKGHFDTPLKAHYLSDGSLRFICLMTLLLQPLELLPDTILIDEPELGLHPYAIAILADVIKQVSEEKQIIISTQSVGLVNHFEPNDIIVVNQKDGVSDFQRLDNEALESWLEDYSLGELWESNLLGGRP